MSRRTKKPAIDSPSTVNAAPPRGGSTLILAAVVACFVLSGFAALLYQTAWLRQFSLVFGTSELAVATVLAAYMAGLAAGAAVAGRYVDRIRRPVLAYALLEAGIAVTALAVPALVSLASGAYVWFLGDRPAPPDAATFGQPLFYLVVTFVVLALPTGLMGATLPLLTKYAVRSDAQVGPRVALLYASNTFGAVLGTVTAGFVLLPALGLRATVWVGVAVNVMVFAIAAGLARGRVSDSEKERVKAAASPLAGFWASCLRPLLDRTGGASARSAALAEQPAWVLPLMLFSGANAFFYEVLWTRMLSHVLGASIYAFSTMLAAFLSGIALGGGIVGRWVATRTQAAVGLVVVQVAIALAAAGAYASMGALIPDTRGIGPYASYALLVMLPAALFIGATFPLAVRLLSPSEREVGPATASVYAWNTLGAIAGSIAAGFVLIPALGFEGSIRLAVAINLALALWAALCLAPRRRWAIATLGAALLVAALVYRPARPVAVVQHTGFAYAMQGAIEEIYFAVGRSATVMLAERGSKLDLRSNGLPEATILTAGSPPLGQTQQWLSALPIAARPDARRMLMVGFGGGNALEQLPGSLTEIDVVELEPEVIAANEHIAERRSDDPLADPRVTIVINDARNALALTSRRYDIIVSQPSHPWTAGASHLFTREFASLVREHLEDDGVFVQWMSASFVDAELLASLAAGLVETYEYTRLYQVDGSTLMFLASDAPLDLEARVAETGRPLNDNRLYYSYLGINGVEDLVAALILDEAGVVEFAAGAPIATDDRNLMATHSRFLSDGLDSDALMELVESMDPLLDADGWVHETLAPRLDFIYLANRLLAQGQIGRAAALADRVRDRSTSTMITGMVQATRGDQLAARASFLGALEQNAGNDAARFALLEPRLAAVATGRADADAMALSRGFRGSAGALIEGWRLAADADWRGLADLDRELGRSNPTDLWFPEATQLRAEWRTQVVGEPSYSFDAMRMIDRALVLRPEMDLFILRAAAAEMLEDVSAFTATCDYAAEFMQSRLEADASGSIVLSRAELELTARRMIALRVRLIEIADEGYETARRVAAELESAIIELQRRARDR